MGSLAVPITVDVIDRSGHPGLAQAVAGRLTAGGIVVRAVTSEKPSIGVPNFSAIHFSAGRYVPAARLAALHHSGLVYRTDVPGVTVVLGDEDPTGLLAALRHFTGLSPQPCPTP